ncbi:MAG TPA: arginine--tRNA ligase [Solirubrobacterales bacterium]|nr:arginine--tRNA ligase [Solirubrobacterales bacterium]
MSAERASDPIAELRSAVGRAALALRGGEPAGPEPTLERPPKPELGDYSSNAAMLLAAPLGESPRAVAERLCGELERELGANGSLERVEVAGPGFVNLFLSDAWYRRAMASLAAAGERLGPAPTESPERVLVEFVSANPTGPLHVGGGRHAAYGDALVRLLEAVGHEVQREYYVNDAGGQIERFAASIAARMRGEEPPKDGYAGEYVAELAAGFAAAGVDPGDTEALGRRGVEAVVEKVRATLDRFGVRFDTWLSERALYERGEVEVALGRLEESGHTYRSEEALWLRTTTFGDDKDRVLIRANGEPTYLAADVAYHWDKLERGFGRLVDVFGADHHGYVPRLRAVVAGLGHDPERLEVLIMRLVHIVEGGERAQMSKRSGDFVSLDELLDDIGADATRWFMLWRSHDTTVDLDLELARRQSNDNPVYYVQYAHARIASILRKAGKDAESAAPVDAEIPGVGLEPAERALVKRLLEFPGEVREAAARRAPHRICTYATAVAADFHAFYRDCQVVGAEGEGVEQSRLALCLLAKRTIAGSLDLLGISAPERM